ncbi:hypothetical protein PORUE0001_1886 [Porphyromonas uenonis 60-3]|uniref:Uncharacterized protein n=1 Tax=Porphyromonas uenonis 60-3 TaxID=596327 RepID=C2MEG8_9PORP|nr:hypothetical protein [Porphyromonas uenonis]EEK15885.1 hypothetical protein PORUE0001_1886 [Porphyromonas uenonis 60-3]
MLEIIKEDEEMYRHYLHLISCKVGLVTSVMLIVFTDNFKGGVPRRWLATAV